MQTTSHILMIRPVNFDFNTQTAINNTFQVFTDNKNIQEKAVSEFDGLVEKLRSEGLEITVVNDTADPHTPDSIFPNNWISFHEGGTVVLYPMFAVNRRAERKPAVLKEVKKKFLVRNTIDLSKYEQQGKFLEGTGSMVLDRDKKIAYACLSPRTDEELFMQCCKELHYHAVVFHAVDHNGAAIYHTNVMMCVADRYVVICLPSISLEEEHIQVINTIKNSGKELIEISIEQMNQFAGNMLQVEDQNKRKLLVMSSQAYNSLTAFQADRLKSFNKIIHVPLTTIETNGGGSVRCMMAELFLPLLK